MIGALEGPARRGPLEAPPHRMLRVADQSYAAVELRAGAATWGMQPATTKHRSDGTRTRDLPRDRTATGAGGKYQWLKRRQVI